MSQLESRRANDERDDVKEKLAEKEKEVDRLQRLVEEMTQVSSQGGQLVDTAKDGSSASSIHNESITIDDNLEPVEELSATDEASPNAEDTIESVMPNTEDESSAREPHESKETLLADPEDESIVREPHESFVPAPSNSGEHLQQRSSLTFGDGDNSPQPEDQLDEVGLDDDDDGDLDPFATYDASARSVMSGSGDTGSSVEAVASPLKLFMQNRRKNEEAS